MQADLSETSSVIALILFCLLATGSYLVMQVYVSVAPATAGVRLRGLNDWIGSHTDQIIIAVSVFIGAWLIARATYQLLSRAVQPVTWSCRRSVLFSAKHSGRRIRHSLRRPSTREPLTRSSTHASAGAGTAAPCGGADRHDPDGSDQHCRARVRRAPGRPRVSMGRGGGADRLCPAFVPGHGPRSQHRVNDWDVDAPAEADWKQIVRRWEHIDVFHFVPRRSSHSSSSPSPGPFNCTDRRPRRYRHRNRRSRPDLRDGSMSPPDTCLLCHHVRSPWPGSPSWLLATKTSAIGIFHQSQ